MASSSRGRAGRSGSHTGARPGGRPDMRYPDARTPSSKAGPADAKPVPQVGKRPSPPALLFAIGAIWVAAGIVLVFALHSSWKLVPVVVSIGIGVLYLRGGITALARRAAHP